jgi:hypothetical protein
MLKQVQVVCCHWLAAGGGDAARALQRTQQPTIAKLCNGRRRLVMKALPLE